MNTGTLLKEGVKLFAKHRQNDPNVLETITLDMNTTEIGNRKRKTKVSVECQQRRRK